MSKKEDKADQKPDENAKVGAELLTDEELKERLGKRVAASVTETYLKSRVDLSEVEYTRIGETLTVCTIKLPSGYTVVGTSACVKPENFDEEIGKKIAYQNAFNELWPLYGFILAEIGGLPRPELEKKEKAA